MRSETSEEYTVFDTTANGVPMVVNADETPMTTWEPASVNEIFTNTTNDVDAGLPEFPRTDNRLFNKDLAEAVFCFASEPSAPFKVAERTINKQDTDPRGKPILRAITIPEHDAVRTFVALYNRSTGAWDAPKLAELSGGWLLPQLRDFTPLQLRTRAWTLRHNHSLEGSPWMLARPDREMLGTSHVPAKKRVGPMDYASFEAGFLRLGYTREEVLELIGKKDFIGVDFDATLTLLERTKGSAQVRENVGKKPVVHAG